MPFLTGSQLKGRLLEMPYKDAVSLCEGGRWADLGDQLGIYPFKEENLGTVVYDLTVGHEAYSLRKGEKQVLSGEHPLKIEPGETVLVLTHEYLIFTPKHCGLVLTRVRIMGEGLSQTSGRIDPTWYGRLYVSLTNNTRSVITLRQGEVFCTVAFAELAEPIPKELHLTRKTVPFLGQTALEYVPSHAAPWRPAKPGAVMLDDLDGTVDLFGPPFDIVRGAIHRVKQDIIDWMEQRWAPNALRELRSLIWKEEVEILKRSLEEQGRQTHQLLVALILLVIGWLVALFFRGK
jgi:deoxycytidine triphosphate deaminase